MLTTQIVGNARNDAVMRQIMDAVADAIEESRVQVKCEIYCERIKLAGQPTMTGRNTILIKIDDGSPEVDVMIDPGDCCGGE